MVPNRLWPNALKRAQPWLTWTFTPPVWMFTWGEVRGCVCVWVLVGVWVCSLRSGLDVNMNKKGLYIWIYGDYLCLRMRINSYTLCNLSIFLPLSLSLLLPIPLSLFLWRSLSVFLSLSLSLSLSFTPTRAMLVFVIIDCNISFMHSSLHWHTHLQIHLMMKSWGVGARRCGPLNFI